jgi:acetylglutamate/LysW-gamma-L-alpha-aminoadipate kinase
MMVVKLGGAAGITYDHALEDVARLQDVVLVHGGSAELNRISEELGHPPVMVTSASGHVSRRTDRQTLELFAMVLRGRINTLIVEKLHQLGVNACGLSGVDGSVLCGRRKSIIITEEGKKKVLRDDYTGTIETVNVHILTWLLQNGMMPIIAPLALSNENEALNVDADRAAAHIAGALQAQTLILLSNVPGLLRDPADTTTLIHRISRDHLAAYRDYAQGRMKKKILATEEALARGVNRVIIADARIPSPVSKALRGKGTVIE